MHIVTRGGHFYKDTCILKRTSARITSKLMQSYQGKKQGCGVGRHYTECAKSLDMRHGRLEELNFMMAEI